MYTHTQLPVLMSVATHEYNCDMKLLSQPSHNAYSCYLVGCHHLSMHDSIILGTVETHCRCIESVVKGQGTICHLAVAFIPHVEN